LILCGVTGLSYRGVEGFCEAVRKVLEDWRGLPLVKTRFALKDLLAERYVLIQPFASEHPEARWLKVADLPDWLIEKLRAAPRKIDVAVEVCKLAKHK